MNLNLPERFLSGTELEALTNHLANEWTESFKGIGHKANVAVDIISPRKLA